MFGNQIIMMCADFHHLKKKIWRKKKEKKRESRIAFHIIKNKIILKTRDKAYSWQQDYIK